jgi:hypothetical protein
VLIGVCDHAGVEIASKLAATISRGTAFMAVLIISDGQAARLTRFLHKQTVGTQG